MRTHKFTSRSDDVPNQMRTHNSAFRADDSHTRIRNLGTLNLCNLRNVLCAI